MSVIVWDGTTLAADRQATNANLRRSVSKIFRHGDLLIAFAGDLVSCEAVRQWLVDGAKREDYPTPSSDERSDVWVITRDGKIAKFEGSPYVLAFNDTILAEGSGRDFAYGAMAMGADAARAVEVACLYDIHCGGGVDTLRFDD